MSLPDETEQKWKKLLDDGPLKAPPFVDTAICAKLLANQERYLVKHMTYREAHDILPESIV